MHKFFKHFFALLLLASPALATCDIKPEKGSAKACFDVLNTEWEQVKNNDSSPLYQPLSRALKSMNAAATSCDGPRTVNCARMTENAQRSYAAYKEAGGGAPATVAAAGGGKNQAEFDSFKRMVTKVQANNNPELKVLKDKILNINKVSEKVCANLDSTECTNLLNEAKIPLFSFAKAVQGARTGAAAAGTTAAKEKVVSLNTKRPTRSKK